MSIEPFRKSISIKTQQVITSQGTHIRNYRFGDVPNSKGCHYQSSCQYQCDGIDEKVKDLGEINNDTYQMEHAKLEMIAMKRKN